MRQTLVQALLTIGLDGKPSTRIPDPEREYAFARPRKFRFDFAWPVHRVALEIEGAAFVRGRHTRGAGFATDCFKYSLAAASGWIVLRVTYAQIRSEFDVWRELLERAIARGKARSRRQVFRTAKEATA